MSRWCVSSTPFSSGFFYVIKLVGSQAESREGGSSGNFLQKKGGWGGGVQPLTRTICIEIFSKRGGGGGGGGGGGEGSSPGEVTRARQVPQSGQLVGS